MAEDTDPTTDYSTIKDENVPHEAEVTEVIDEQMRRTSSHASIADVADVGAVYDQAEVQAIADAVNGILDVLRDAELLPEPLPPT